MFAVELVAVALKVVIVAVKIVAMRSTICNQACYPGNELAF